MKEVYGVAKNVQTRVEKTFLERVIQTKVEKSCMLLHSGLAVLNECLHTNTCL